MRASALLSLYLSVALAVIAWATAHLLALRSIGLGDFLAISVAGGLGSSVFLLAMTLAVARTSVRRGWDMDNIATPVVTAVGDVVTLPALWAASLVVALPALKSSVELAAGLLLAASTVYLARSHELGLLRRIIAESLPILLIAGLLDVLAGYTIDRRSEHFFTLPALLVLVPPFLEDVGALAGILSARLSSKLHLGTLAPTFLPGAPALADISLTYLLALPVLTLVATSSWLVYDLLGLAHPGLALLVEIALLGGVLAVTGAIAVAYAAAVVTFRRGLDPDNYGVPIITSSVDLVGTLSLVAALITLGVVSQ